MAKFYIAFSIHGTNRFSVAVKNTRHKQKKDESLSDFVKRALGDDFDAAESRRPSYNQSTDGIKVTSTKLLTKTGAPFKTAKAVIKVFLELCAAGWTIARLNGEDFDETKYLTSTPANKARLDKAIDSIKDDSKERAKSAKHYDPKAAKPVRSGVKLELAKPESKPVASKISKTVKLPKK